MDTFLYILEKYTEKIQFKILRENILFHFEKEILVKYQHFSNFSFLESNQKTTTFTK